MLPAQQPVWRPTVEIEEEVYQFQPADNGAGPMWCSGSTCLVRGPRGLVASGLETLPQAKPLNNCRCLLFQRTDEGWKSLPLDDTQRTREPCPLVGFHDGHVFLSTNPTLTEPDKYNGPARPEIVSLNLTGTGPLSEILRPRWQGTPEFSEHSYRSFAADGARGELILLQNIGYDRAEWAFRGADGQWSAAGQLKWPWGAEYDQPEPIRICYPNVMLKNRAVYFCGVSDIIEPYAKWRAYKKELTGRDWDYDFRRLFFTWSDDITTGEFHPWIEIASRDQTCGWIRPCDLWVADDARVHLLWSERALDERLREKFFPAAKQSHALNYAIVKDGQIVSRRSLGISRRGRSARDCRFGSVPSHRGPATVCVLLCQRHEPRRAGNLGEPPTGDPHRRLVQRTGYGSLASTLCQFLHRHRAGRVPFRARHRAARTASRRQQYHRLRPRATLVDAACFSPQRAHRTRLHRTCCGGATTGQLPTVPNRRQSLLPPPAACRREIDWSATVTQTGPFGRAQDIAPNRHAGRPKPNAVCLARHGGARRPEPALLRPRPTGVLVTPALGRRQCRSDWR